MWGEGHGSACWRIGGDGGGMEGVREVGVWGRR